MPVQPGSLLGQTTFDLVVFFPLVVVFSQVIPRLPSFLAAAILYWFIVFRHFQR